MVPTIASAATAAPGAPIRIQAAKPAVEGMPRQLDAAICSQGPVGTVTEADGTKRTIMLTAAHCTMALGDGWEPTSEVFVPRPEGDELIGYREAHRLEETHTGDFSSDLVNFSLGADWAVVELEEGVSTSRLATSVDADGRSQGAGVTLTGIRDYRNLRKNEISADNFGQRICKEGTTSGRSCGWQLFRSQNSVFSYGLDYLDGDSGGVNYDPNTGEVIGMTAAAFGPIGHSQTADAALQAAYGIPDGKVNERFTLAESTEAHDEYRTVSHDAQETNEWLRNNGESQVDKQPAPQTDVPSQVPAAATPASLANQASAQAAAGDVAGLSQTAEQAAALAAAHFPKLP